MEQRGNAPRAAILQGSPAHSCLPLGARTWFRATLSCSSGRRFHQISFPSEVVRMPVIETGPPEWRSEARPSSYIREVVPRRGNDPRQRIGIGFTDRAAPSLRSCVILSENRCPLFGITHRRHTEAWLRARESNSAVPAYETGRVARPLPASRRWRKGEELNPLPIGIRLGFRDRLPSAQRTLPYWSSRGDSNTRPLGSEPSALVRLSYAT